ncbi:MAG: type I methionyl aminopeptidase [Gemmataceae bacterium]
MLRSLFQKAPELKSAREVALMREAGKVVVEALRICRAMAKPGTRTIDIDRAVEEHYARHNALPLFKGYPGQHCPFPAVTCLSINEQVVHGIPGARELREGDLFKVDTACKLNGWCADSAMTLMIGEVSPEKRRLVKVAYEVLEIARTELGRCKRWHEVASRMQRHAEQNGFTMVEQYVGHGIGRVMHENPQVANYVPRNAREARKQDFRLEPGLVLAIEPMLNMGRHDVKVLSDHWTVVTANGLPSAHVEHTFALTPEGVLVLTAPDMQPASLDPYDPSNLPAAARAVESNANGEQSSPTS